MTDPEESTMTRLTCGYTAATDRNMSNAIPVPVGYLGNARDWSSQLSKLRTEYNALRADLRAIRFCEPESSEAQYVARRVVELCKWNRWEIPLEALST